MNVCSNRIHRDSKAHIKLRLIGKEVKRLRGVGVGRYFIVFVLTLFKLFRLISKQAKSSENLFRKAYSSVFFYE